jgi:hypothetical protein
MTRLASPDPPSLLTPAKKRLLERIGAVGEQEQVLAAIVDYSNRRFRAMRRLARSVDHNPNQLIRASSFLPLRVMDHLTVNQAVGCWECDYYANRYPQLWDEVSGRSGVKAYRYVFERMARPLAKGEQVEHICRQEKCVWWELHLGVVSGRHNLDRKTLGRRHLRQPALFATSEYEEELMALGLYPPLR